MIRLKIGSRAHAANPQLPTAEDLKEALLSIEGELIQYRAKARQDTINFPVKLNAKLAALRSVVETLEGRPTEQTYALFAELSALLQVQIDRLEYFVASDVTAFNAATANSGCPTIIV